MHVLLLASSSFSLVNFRGPLIKDMLSLGYKVSVCAPDFKDDIVDYFNELSVSVHQSSVDRAGLGPLSDLKYLLYLFKLIRNIGPDIVITYTAKPNIWGGFASFFCGVPSIAMVTGLGYYFTDGGEASTKKSLVGYVVKRLYRAATSCNKYVIFQNQDDRNDFIEAGCLADSSKAHVVDGSGVDMTHYSRSLLPQSMVFLMLSRLLRSKGVEEYVAAAQHLKSKYPEVRFLLAGPVDDGPDAINPDHVKSWKLGSYIEYLGSVDDVRGVIKEASVYVLPSYREGTPRSVLEAMAMGRAVITTDVPGCRQTIRDGLDGFLVPPRDIDSLSEAMARFIENRDLAEKMGGAAFERASDKYEVSKINSQVIGVVSSVFSECEMEG